MAVTQYSCIETPAAEEVVELSPVQIENVMLVERITNIHSALDNLQERLSSVLIAETEEDKVKSPSQELPEYNLGAQLRNHSISLEVIEDRIRSLSRRCQL
jgi:hypothetical protein